MNSTDVPPSALRLIVVTVILVVALAACGGSTPPKTKTSQRGMTEDIGGVLEEKEFKESEVALPPYPDDSTLLEFQPRRNSPNRFFVDRNSVSIGPDRVIRYSAIVKSPSDATNISYEAMRCKTSEYKVYAFGVTRGEWTKAPDPQWRKVPRMTGDFRFALYKDYFCDLEAIAGRNAKDLIANLAGNPLNNVTDKNR
jgi:hypothetical protein